MFALLQKAPRERRFMICEFSRLCSNAEGRSKAESAFPKFHLWSLSRLSSSSPAEILTPALYLHWHAPLCWHPSVFSVRLGSPATWTGLQLIAVTPDLQVFTLRRHNLIFMSLCCISVFTFITSEDRKTQYLLFRRFSCCLEAPGNTKSTSKF